MSSETPDRRSSEVPPIRSTRLRLIWLSPEAMGALRAGDRSRAEGLLEVRLPPEWPDERADDLLRMRLDDMAVDPMARPWLARVMTLDDGRVIGHIGFHGRPDDRGRAEVGYTVFEAFRRRGYALEAVRALLAWAESEHGVHRFVASVSPDNGASLALVGKLGFERTGEQWDERDGLEWVFELDTRARAG